MALSSITGGEPRLADLLARRAHIHLQQHLQNGQIDELDQAMTTLQVAVHLAKSGPERVHLGSMLNMLGILSLRRYARNANEVVLDDALHHFSWALECFSDSHPRRVIALAGIAQTRASRYDRTGAMLDLEEAISQIQTAIHIQRRFNDTDLLAIALNNLGCVLWRRYQRTGSSENLHEAFTAMTKAAAAVSPDNAELLGSIWTNLAGLLARQYEVTHVLEHLGNAVFEAREIARAAPESPELDLLLGVLGKLARREHARREIVSKRATPPLSSFYSGSLVLSIAVSLLVVFCNHSKMLLYPVVFLAGACCSGVTSQLYRKIKEGSTISRCTYTQSESSSTPSEAIPKILDLPLFDDHLFETIQTWSEKGAPGMEYPANFVDDHTITEREDICGNNENEYYARSTRHAPNESSDFSFHDREADQVSQVEKGNPSIAVSKPQPNENTPNDEWFSSNRLGSDRSPDEMENGKLWFTNVKSDQKKQVQTLNAVPATVDIEQIPYQETTKAVTKPKSDQTPERVHNVNVTGKLSIDPSGYLAPEQLSSTHLPSISSSMQPTGGDAQSTTNTENTSHAPAAFRNPEKKEVGKKLRNFSLPNSMSQQDARRDSQEPIAASQGNTTHDVHKNEGNAMGNLFSRRADVVGHKSRHYGDKLEVNHYTVPRNSTNATGAEIPTARSSQLPSFESPSKAPSKASIISHYPSLSPSDPLSKTLVQFPQTGEEASGEVSRSKPPPGKNPRVSPRADKRSSKRPPLDKERKQAPHARNRSRRRMGEFFKRDHIEDTSAEVAYPRMMNKFGKPDTEGSVSHASNTAQTEWRGKPDPSPPRYKRVDPPDFTRTGDEKRSYPSYKHHQLHGLEDMTKGFYDDDDSFSEPSADSSKLNDAMDHIQQSRVARRKIIPASQLEDVPSAYNSARIYRDDTREYFSLATI